MISLLIITLDNQEFITVIKGKFDSAKFQAHDISCKKWEKF